MAAMASSHRVSLFSASLEPQSGQQLSRLLDAVPGQPILIGRSSKSENKGLAPATHNAYYDCKVMSRNHATLETITGLPDSLTITDTSKYGTFVNGMRLSKSVATTLRSGDTLKFGDEVSTSIYEITHKPVEVRITFNDVASRTAPLVQQPVFGSPFVFPSSDCNDDDDEDDGNEEYEYNCNYIDDSSEHDSFHEDIDHSSTYSTPPEDDVLDQSMSQLLGEEPEIKSCKVEPDLAQEINKVKPLPDLDDWSVVDQDEDLDQLSDRLHPSSSTYATLADPKPLHHSMLSKQALQPSSQHDYTVGLSSLARLETERSQLAVKVDNMVASLDHSIMLGSKLPSKEACHRSPLSRSDHPMPPIGWLDTFVISDHGMSSVDDTIRHQSPVTMLPDMSQPKKNNQQSSNETRMSIDKLINGPSDKALPATAIEERGCAVTTMTANADVAEQPIERTSDNDHLRAIALAMESADMDIAQRQALRKVRPARPAAKVKRTHRGTRTVHQAFKVSKCSATPRSANTVQQFRSVLSTAMSATVYAALGSIATISFLASPLAERLAGL